MLSYFGDARPGFISAEAAGAMSPSRETRNSWARRAGMGRGERTTANRSAATPAWKPQRICKGKKDAMQAKSITGGQVRERLKAHTPS